MDINQDWLLFFIVLLYQLDCPVYGRLTSGPDDVTVVAGGEANLTCVTDPPEKVYWLFTPVDSVKREMVFYGSTEIVPWKFKKRLSVLVGGPGVSILRITNVSLVDVGNYTCVAEVGGFGEDEEATATLSLNHTEFKDKTAAYNNSGNTNILYEDMEVNQIAVFSAFGAMSAIILITAIVFMFLRMSRIMGRIPIRVPKVNNDKGIPSDTSFLSSDKNVEILLRSLLPAPPSTCFVEDDEGISVLLEDDREDEIETLLPVNGYPVTCVVDCLDTVRTDINDICKDRGEEHTLITIVDSQCLQKSSNNSANIQTNPRISSSQISIDPASSDHIPNTIDTDEISPADDLITIQELLDIAGMAAVADAEVLPGQRQVCDSDELISNHTLAICHTDLMTDVVSSQAPNLICQIDDSIYGQSGVTPADNFLLSNESVISDKMIHTSGIVFSGVLAISSVFLTNDDPVQLSKIDQATSMIEMLDADPRADIPCNESETSDMVQPNKILFNQVPVIIAQAIDPLDSPVLVTSLEHEAAGTGSHPQPIPHNSDLIESHDTDSSQAPGTADLAKSCNLVPTEVKKIFEHSVNGVPTSKVSEESVLNVSDGEYVYFNGQQQFDHVDTDVEASDGYLPCGSATLKICKREVSRPVMSPHHLPKDRAAAQKSLPQLNEGDTKLLINESTPIGLKWRGFTIASTVSENIQIVITNSPRYQPPTALLCTRISDIFHCLPHNCKFDQPILFTVEIDRVHDGDVIEVLYSPTNLNEVPQWGKLSVVHRPDGDMLCDDQDPPNRVMLPLDGFNQVLFSLNHFCVFTIVVKGKEEKYKNAAMSALLRARRGEVESVVSLRILVGCNEKSLEDMEKLAIGNGFRKIDSNFYPLYESREDLELVLEKITLDEDIIHIDEPRQKLLKPSLWTSSSSVNFNFKSKLVRQCDYNLTASLTIVQQGSEPMKMNILECLEKELSFPVSDHKSTATMMAPDADHCSRDILQLRADSISMDLQPALQPQPFRDVCFRSVDVRSLHLKADASVTEDDHISMSSLCTLGPAAPATTAYVTRFKSSLSSEPDEAAAAASTPTAAATASTPTAAAPTRTPTAAAAAPTTTAAAAPTAAAAANRVDAYFPVASSLDAGGNNVTDVSKFPRGSVGRSSEKGYSTAPGFCVTVHNADIEGPPNYQAKNADTQAVTTYQNRKGDQDQKVTADQDQKVTSDHNQKVDTDQDQKVTTDQDQKVTADHNQKLAVEQKVTAHPSVTASMDQRLCIQETEENRGDAYISSLQAVEADDREKFIDDVLRMLGWGRLMFPHKDWTSIIKAIALFPRGREKLDEMFETQLMRHFTNAT